MPVFLAELNGALGCGMKSMLSDVITDEVQCPKALDIKDQTACLITDGQVHVIALGKPQDSGTFGELADIFVTAALQVEITYQQTDVAFDMFRVFDIHP